MAMALSGVMNCDLSVKEGEICLRVEVPAADVIYHVNMMLVMCCIDITSTVAFYG
jgi:hypothetical protein